MPHPIRFILRSLFALWLLFLLMVALAFGDPEDWA